MLSRYNAIEVEIALRTAPSPPPPFPRASDRAAWTAVASWLGEAQVKKMISAGEIAAQAEIPALPATLFLEFKRKGERAGYEQPQWQRRLLLKDLVLAECLEYRGRFLDPILNITWAICEESSWVYPAHQSDLTDLARPVIDLGAASMALELAEMELLVGRELDPLLSKRIRDEIDRRILTPYLTEHYHWWLYGTSERQVNNWTAVCNAGVAGAALYLEKNTGRLAEIIARAAHSLDSYLATFDQDGGSSEGPGYWSYGFSHYTLLAHLVAHRTGGRIDFLAGESLRQIASYPLRTVLSPGTYVNFSDADLNVTYSRPHLAFLARQLELPQLAALAGEHPPEPNSLNLSWALRDLFWQPQLSSPASFIPAPQDWFGGIMWLIARYRPDDPQTLVLAAKGGHNAEMHNQNDVGNIIVHANGESIIADVGRGRYTKAYFGPERYDHFVNASLGHSVPCPNSCLQQDGREYGAELLDYQAGEQQDTLYLELKGAYPAEARLASLCRRVTLHREPPAGWVELVDEVRFDGSPAPFESALITLGKVEIGPDGVVLRGQQGKLRVGFDPERVEVRVDLYPEVDLAIGPTDVRRVVFSFKEPVQAGILLLEIVPV